MTISTIIGILSIAIPAFLKIAEMARKSQEDNPRTDPYPHEDDTGRPVLDAFRRWGRTRQRMLRQKRKRTNYDF